MTENNKPIQKLVIDTVTNSAQETFENVNENVNVTDITNSASEVVSNINEIKETVTENIPVEATIPVENIQESPKQESPKQKSVSYPSHSLIQDPLTLKMLKSLNFWAKFIAIVQMIGAGLVIFSGLIYIFTIILIPFTLVYWVMGGLSIWIAIKLYNSASKFNNLSLVSDQEGFNSNVLSGLNELKSYFKIQGILTIISLVFGFVALIAIIGFGLLGAFNINNSLKSNPKYPVNNSYLPTDFDNI